MSCTFNSVYMEAWSYLSPEQQASLMRSAEKPMGKLIDSYEPRELYTIGCPAEPSITIKLDFGL